MFRDNGISPQTVESRKQVHTESPIGICGIREYQYENLQEIKEDYTRTLDDLLYYLKLNESITHGTDITYA